MNIKPGWQTSEFWMTVTSSIVGMLALFGVVTKEEADSIVVLVQSLVTALIGLALAVAPIVAYIKSRAEIKRAHAWEAEALASE